MLCGLAVKEMHNYSMAKKKEITLTQPTVSTYTGSSSVANVRRRSGAGASAATLLAAFKGW